MEHDELKQAALDAIQALHGDTSVSMEQTLESLEEIRDDVDGLIYLVAEDIRRKV